MIYHGLSVGFFFRKVIKLSRGIAARVRVWIVPQALNSTANLGCDFIIRGFNDIDEVILTEKGILVNYFDSHILYLFVDLLNPVWIL